MFAVCVIALCLMPVSHLAPLACSVLEIVVAAPEIVVNYEPPPLLFCDHSLRLLNRSDLEGRWALVAGSLSDPADLENFKLGDSLSANFINGSEASTMSYTGIFRFGASCRYLRSNITLEHSSFHLEPLNLTVTALQGSCPDCLVMHFVNKSLELKRLYLFSRRRELEQKEMEEFKVMVQCFDMPAPILMDPTKDLCPDQLPTEPAAPSEEKPVA